MGSTALEHQYCTELPGGSRNSPVPAEPGGSRGILGTAAVLGSAWDLGWPLGSGLSFQQCHCVLPAGELCLTLGWQWGCPRTCSLFPFPALPAACHKLGQLGVLSLAPFPGSAQALEPSPWLNPSAASPHGGDVASSQSPLAFQQCQGWDCFPVTAGLSCP